MFDPMDFQHRLVTIECAGKSILSDPEFRERTASQRFEKLVRVAPFGPDHLVDFRDDSVLRVGRGSRIPRPPGA